MLTYDVSTIPCVVTVADDRGTVQGIYVSVEISNEIRTETIMGTVIPIEGDSIDCWAERQLCRVLPRDLLLVLGGIASDPKKLIFTYTSGINLSR